MSVHRYWDVAANHAKFDIEAFGNWLCQCRPCKVMRTRIFRGITEGLCQNDSCYRPVKNRKSKYCSAACKQQNYRQRRASR